MTKHWRKSDMSIFRKSFRYQSAALADLGQLNEFYPSLKAGEGGFRIGDIEISKKDRTQHILVVGGTGAGKGVTLMIPNLIRDMYSNISSVFVDIKAPEMYDTLCGAARKIPGRVFCSFSPFHPEKTVLWNPIDGVTTFGQATEWTEIILNNSSSSDKITGASAGADHYRQLEKALLRSLIMFVNNNVYKERFWNNIATIVQHLLGSKAATASRKQALLKELKNSDYMLPSEIKRGKLERAWDLISDDLSSVINLDEEKFGGIIDSLKNRLSLFKDPRVAAATSRTEISLKQLGKTPMTLVLGVPTTEAAKSKLITAMFLSALVKELREEACASPGNALPVQVALYLDECGNLGRFDLPEWLSALRSQNVSIIAVFQDLGQIGESFGEDRKISILTNTQNQVVLYGSSSDTGKYYSAKIGKLEDERDVVGKSKSRSTTSSSTGVSVNKRQMLYDLMPSHAIEKMIWNGTIGIEYKRQRSIFHLLFGWLLKSIGLKNLAAAPIEKNKKGDPILESVRALVFTFKCMPTITNLEPFFKYKNIMELMGTEIYPLRGEGGPLEALDFEKILNWENAGRMEVEEIKVQMPNESLPIIGTSRRKTKKDKVSHGSETIETTSTSANNFVIEIDPNEF
jgi:type IV secretory pathway TraG/TraD family ATPase VirD4